MQPKLIPTLLVAIFFSCTFNAFSQKALKLNSLVNGKERLLHPRDLITIRYVDATQKLKHRPLLYLGRQLHFLSGRLIAINDSSITCKKLIGRKTYVVRYENITQIRKESIAEAAIFGLGTGLVVGAIAYKNPMPALFLSIIPITLVWEKVIDPLKNINPKFYKGRNRWRLQVIE